MSRAKKALAAIAVLSALIAAAIPALAHSEAETALSEQSREERRAERQTERQAERRAAVAAGLAEELGIAEATVADALDKVLDDLAEQARAERRGSLEARLDEAVASGRLTQEQADAILEGFDSGALQTLRRFHRRHRAAGDAWS